MTDLEQGELRVVVPVGFLLAEEQEVTVSVNRPDGSPLPIRLCLIPARTTVSDDTPAALADHAPGTIVGWPTRRLTTHLDDDDDGDGYPGYDMGGSD